MAKNFNEEMQKTSCISNFPEITDLQGAGLHNYLGALFYNFNILSVVEAPLP